MASDVPEPGPDMIAAELALGLLDGEEQAAALRRTLAEPGFAAEVEAWRMRFAALFATWPEHAPPPELEARVLAGTEPMPIAPGLPRRWWPVAGIAAAAMVALAVVPTLRRPPVPVPPTRPAAVAPLLAAIASSTGAPPVAAAYDRAAGTIRLVGAVRTPAGRSAQLWAINGKAAPRPLGLLGGAATRIAVTPALRASLASGTVLAVSIEPAGGSPTGLPTGPVVATGTLAAA